MDNSTALAIAVILQPAAFLLVRYVLSPIPGWIRRRMADGRLKRFLLISWDV